MMRRLFLSMVPSSLFGWRVHILARHECAAGGVLSLLLRGEPWKLTAHERALVDEIARKLRELEPGEMQQQLPRNL
jgi:hypothetical protein